MTTRNAAHNPTAGGPPRRGPDAMAAAVIWCGIWEGASS